MLRPQIHTPAPILHALGVKFALTIRSCSRTKSKTLTLCRCLFSSVDSPLDALLSYYGWMAASANWSVWSRQFYSLLAFGRLVEGVIGANTSAWSIGLRVWLPPTPQGVFATEQRTSGIATLLLQYPCFAFWQHRRTQGDILISLHGELCNNDYSAKPNWSCCISHAAAVGILACDGFPHACWHAKLLRWL